ncbi:MULTISPECIES: hypothetical protein [Streptomyces]|uniref:Uncharacterized protein n=2 Tax=Streptomyces TaxID=1883 RepID=A0ABV9ITT1_9ACTN
MAGKATGVEVTYKCGDCKEEFTVCQNVGPDAFQIVLSLEEEHEDCPKGDS